MDKCSHIHTIQTGDESLDYCSINDWLCDLISDSTCEVWEEIKKKMRDNNDVWNEMY